MGVRFSARPRAWARPWCSHEQSTRRDRQRVVSPLRAARLTPPRSTAASPVDWVLRQRRLDRATESEAWRTLEQAVRVCLASGFQVILAVDESGMPKFSVADEALCRLGHLGARERGRVTVLLAFDGSSGQDAVFWPSDWTLVIGLAPLSCDEAEIYLAAKLAAAECTQAIFDPSAVTRLHLHSAGSPRGLDRLASLCLMAAAAIGQETVSAELVESILSTGSSK